MASYCSQNYGAEKYERIRIGIKKSILFSWIWCAVVVAITYTFVPFLIKAITSTNVYEIINTGTLYLRIDTLLYFVATVVSIARNALQGIGDHLTPIISNTINNHAEEKQCIFLIL